MLFVRLGVVKVEKEADARRVGVGGPCGSQVVSRSYDLCTLSPLPTLHSLGYSCASLTRKMLAHMS
jgi:hypothetical protein